MRKDRKYDLICFDVDGTLIKHPTDKVIWEILNIRFTGDDSVNRDRYQMYIDGEISYADWVRLDVGGWIEAGATRAQVVEAVREFHVYEGALETVRALKQHGILPWLDEWELRPGLPWIPELERRIESIRCAAVFVGPAGLGPWQDRELDALLRAFVSRGCPVIPVILEGAPEQPELPLFLRGHTWVDFRVSEPDPIERLIWGITGDRSKRVGR